MIPPLDPFALSFDSIEIDPTRAPSQAAIDHALAFCAPEGAASRDESPGFYLVDDASGLFSVDREMGVIALKDESLLARAPGAIYAARLRVVEPSGASYELDLKLRLTGAVPQVVGAEEFGFLAAMTSEPLAAPQPQAPVAAAPIARPTVFAAWSRYAAANAVRGKADLVRTRRAFIAPELPPLTPALETISLVLTEPLPQTGANAPWSL